MDGRSRRLKPREALTCGNCGKSFMVIAGNAKQQQWCSRACGYEGIKKRTATKGKIVPCKHCGKERFVAAKDLIRFRSLYCDRACMLAHRKERSNARMLDRLCRQCGKVFQIQPHELRGSHVWQFCSTDCHKAEKADKARRRDGERIMNPHGYIEVYAFDHPSVKDRPRGTRRVMEHRLVMEKVLGRYLFPFEQVHHKNKIKHDNRPENLELWVGKQPIGVRVADVYNKDIERLALENLQLKQRITELEGHT